MAIQSRRGPENELDKSKLLPGETATTFDTKKIFHAFRPGDVDQMATIEDVQTLLDVSPEAYAALQALIAELENNPELATTILNNISDLQSSKLDKTGDSKDNKVSFTQASTLSNINTGESHATIFGKIKKFFAFLGTTTLTTVAQTISSAINELVSGKINKTDIVNTDTVNDTTKVASAAVARALGLEIDTLNNNLALLDKQNLNSNSVVTSATDILATDNVTMVFAGTFVPVWVPIGGSAYGILRRTTTGAYVVYEYFDVGLKQKFFQTQSSLMPPVQTDWIHG